MPVAHDSPRRLLPTVLGKGMLGIGPHQASNNGKRVKTYVVWCNMLERCYSTKEHILKRTLYDNCTVCDEWLNYQNFAEWCYAQIGFGNDEWCLDKDVIVKYNKLYSPSTCAFIPQELNKLIYVRPTDEKRGPWPIGVFYSKRDKRYVAAIKKNLEYEYLKQCTTPEEAFLYYKRAKELHIKEQANKWKDQIDKRVYNSLMGFELTIDD